MTPTEPRAPFFAEARETLRLGWPLAVAQLATIALNTTDVVMLGWLGPVELAGGAIGMSVLHTTFIFGLGLVISSAPLTAQALGARSARGVRRTVRQGLWLALAMSICAAPLFLFAEEILLSLGQSRTTARFGAEYMRAAAGMLPFALSAVCLRVLLSAHGRTRTVLAISLTGVAINAAGDAVLIFGLAGAPRLGAAGAGLATAFAHAGMAAIYVAIVHSRPPFRRYRIFARFLRPDWPRFMMMLRLGAPIAVMLFSEAALFAGAALLMGRIGTETLAAHAVATQIISTTFMIPLGLSQATTLRVGLNHGVGDAAATGRAGWVGIALAALAMGCSAILLLSAPRSLIGLFLDLNDAANARVIVLATGFLVIAALFQVADGVQVAAAASLRGLSDTRTPALVALTGYWAIGIPTGWLLAFPLGWGGDGVWWGMLAGLASAAVALTWRFRLLVRRISAARSR